MNKHIKRLTQQADLLLLDFDGTFYRFTEEFERHCHEAAARAALKIGAPLTFEEALELTARSYFEYGSSYILLEKEYGLRVENFMAAYHDDLDHGHIAESQVTAEQLIACSIPLALLSHSVRSWILTMLKKFGLDGIIPGERIFAIEDVGYNLKLHSEEPYRFVLDKLGVEAGRTIVVEDTARNLKPAKSLGMTTVLVTQGRAFDNEAYPYVDYAFGDLPEFLEAFNTV